MISSLSRWFRPRARTIRNRDGLRKKTTCKLHVEPLEDRCVPTAGALDPTFGSGGIATAPFVSPTTADVAIGTDGKIVAVATRSNYDFAVARFNSNGSPDTSFGGSGFVTTDFGLWEVSYGVAIDSTGKTVVVGTTLAKQINFTHYYDFALARYNNDGTLDKSFGKNGKVTTNFGVKVSAYASGGVAIQSDGKLVVAGIAGAQIAVARYTTKGALDATFGSGGKAILSSTISAAPARDVAILPNGKILVLKGDGAVRLNANGSLDTTFGDAGQANLPSGIDIPNVANGMAIQPDGKILFAGYVSPGAVGYDAAVARMNANGTMDTDFGSGGVVTVDFVSQTGYSHQGGEAVAVQSDGKILLAGTTGVGVSAWVASTNTMLVRLNADGSLDTGFGTNGHLETPIGSGGDGAYSIALQSDGRAVVAGLADGALTVSRFLTSAPTIGAFTANPNPVTAGEPVTLTALDVQALNPGSTITSVAFYMDSNYNGVLDEDDTLLAGTTAQSGGDWSLVFSTSGWATGTYTLFAQAIDSYGVLSDPVAAELVVD